MKMTSILLDKAHIDFFNKNKQINRSVVIRKMVDEYIAKIRKQNGN